jgi:hypothetical protein
MTMLQLTRRCQAVCGPKVDYWNETDLTPNEFWLFPEMKSALEGRIFQDIEDIKNVSA